MLQALGIGYIPAGSPQAKGRIERLWQTLQDRLVSELRLRGISTLAAATAFLPEFRTDFNRRFAHAPAEATPVWRRPPRDFDELLSCRYERTVARDNTVRLGARLLQIPRGAHGRAYAGCRVELRECLDGRLLAFHHDLRIAQQAASGSEFVLIPRHTARGQRRSASRTASEKGSRSLDTPRNRATEALAHLAALRRSPPPTGSLTPLAPPLHAPRPRDHSHPQTRGVTFSRTS